jgi:hypothetical protein
MIPLKKIPKFPRSYAKCDERKSRGMGNDEFRCVREIAHKLHLNPIREVPKDTLVNERSRLQFGADQAVRLFLTCILQK